MKEDTRVTRSARNKKKLNDKTGKTSSNKKKSKKHLLNQICKFIIFEIIFIGVTSPLMFLYGPFDTVRSSVINTVLATRHAYLVDKFIPKSVLNKVNGGSDSVVTNASNTLEDTSKIEVKYKNSNETTLKKITTDKFDAYLLEVKDPLRIKIALTSKFKTEGEKTSTMAEAHGAIAAINGGSFVQDGANGLQFAGTGALPGGFVIMNGEVKYTDRPYDKRDKNNETTAIGITKSGKLVMGNYSINDLLSMNVSEALCFRPPNLVLNGKRLISNRLEGGFNPRTAIGQKQDGTILLLVTDGRKSVIKAGASLYDVQEIMIKNGAVNAANLDGGYSSTMYYNGEIVNIPNSWDGERSVATCFIVEP